MGRGLRVGRTRERTTGSADRAMRRRLPRRVNLSGMRNQSLWAPWRMTYVQQLEPASPDKDAPRDGACFLCEASEGAAGDAAGAAERLLLLRDDRGMMLLNRYPYTSGHLLLAPAEHVSTLGDLSAEGRAGLMELAAFAEILVGRVYQPQGMNVGINLGRCAGAGLPGHLHVHVVPRWNGDVNFMTTIGDVRVMPQSLEESYRSLLAAMEAQR